jgi:hypothetical protein
MKPMRVKAIVAAVVLLAALLIGWLSGAWHEGRMSEGFRAGMDTSGGMADADAVEYLRSITEAEEGFSNPTQLPIQTRKTGAYLDNGFAQFFSTDSEAHRQQSRDQHSLYFEPTTDDVVCDLTTASTPSARRGCAPHIDTITAQDTMSFLPTSVAPRGTLRGPAAAMPVDATASNVYLSGGIYAFHKTVLHVRAGIVTQTEQAQGRQVQRTFLYMPCGNLSTRVFVLLRPLYVRSNTTAARLYRLNWKDAAADYDSTRSGQNFVVELSELANATIDDAQKNNVSIVKSLASVVSEGTASTAASATGVQSAPLVAYYLRYKMPNAAAYTPFSGRAAAAFASGSGRPTSTIATAFYRIGGDAATVGDYLSVTASPSVADPQRAVVTTVGGQYTLELPKPIRGQGWVMGCVSQNQLTIAYFDSANALLKTFNTGAQLDYTTTKVNSPLPAALKDLPATNFSIPNYAEAAALLGALNEPPPHAQNPVIFGMTLSQIAPAPSPSSPRDTLHGGSALRVGESLENSNFRAYYGADRTLRIVDKATNATVWSTPPTPPPFGADWRAGLAHLSARDGRIRLYSVRSDGTAAIQTPDWELAEDDGFDERVPGPYALKLTIDGRLRVMGGDGQKAVAWSSSAKNPSSGGGDELMLGPSPPS